MKLGIVTLVVLLLGCAPDHRTRIVSKNGQDCARLRYVSEGAYPDWNIDSGAGPANLATLNEAMEFSRQVCGGGNVKVRIEH